MNSPKITVAGYGRTSTLTHGQDINNQKIPIEQAASARGFELVAFYEDRGVSGTKERRKGLDAVMADAKRGRFKVLIVAELSRIARDTRHLLNVLFELSEVNVTLISLRENLTIDDSPFARGMVTLCGLVVSLEAELLRDRIKSALAIRKQSAALTGWRCGRPPKINEDMINAVEKLRASGSSIRQTAKALGVSKTTVLRAARVGQNSSGEIKRKPGSET